MNLLNVKNLSIDFMTSAGLISAVSNVSFALESKKIYGLVGESGSGKSQIFYALMGLLANNAQVSGDAEFDGNPLLRISNADLNKIRGNTLSIIFQDAFSSLNPYRRIDDQMIEVLTHHKNLYCNEAMKISETMLEAVKLSDVKTVMKKYPHELSGGMQQRVLIAMSLLCRPKLLIADEPTTALDVTTQEAILDLLKNLQKEFNMSIVFISHDLGAIAKISEQVMVLYAGQLVEMNSVEKIFSTPRHPYTQALFKSALHLKKYKSELASISGIVSCVNKAYTGCRFRPRCLFKLKACETLNVTLDNAAIHGSACPYSI